MRRAKTMKLQGDTEYAKVAERLRLFREDCPNGLIETSPQFKDETIIFTARVLKDKSSPDSAEAVGHSMGSNKRVKGFEKLETIAVGRALALLGYLASGEIASTEEMEQFQEYKLKKNVKGAIEQLNQAESIDELKKVFMSLGSLMSEVEVVAAKDKRKAELSEDS